MRLAVTAFQERMNNGYSMAYLPTTFKSVENKQYKSGELPADGVTAPALTEKGTYRVLMKYMTPQNNITINTRGLEFDLNLTSFKSGSHSKSRTVRCDSYRFFGQWRLVTDRTVQ